MKEKIKLCKKINKFLSNIFDAYHESFNLVSINLLTKYIPEIDTLQEESSIELAQKIILPFFCSIKKNLVSK